MRVGVGKSQGPGCCSQVVDTRLQPKVAKFQERGLCLGKRSSIRADGLTVAGLAVGAAALAYFGCHVFANPIKMDLTALLIIVAASVPLVLLTCVTYKTYFGKVEESNRRIEKLGKLHLATIESLALAIDAKDQASHDHIRRVRSLAEGLAMAVGYPREQMEGLRAAALLHDIGKLAVPEHILNKPDKLSPAEYAKIMIHPVVGADILSTVDFPYEVVPIVKHHHERFDGSGYPDGLKGPAIPLGARIMTIVDCYDALTNNRPYRPRYSRTRALDLMRREAGHTFDPELLEAFFEVVGPIDDELKQEADERFQSHAKWAATVEQPSFAQTGEAGTPGPKTPAERALRDITAAQREVLSLYEISQTLGSTLTLSEVLPIVATKLENIANCTTIVIFQVAGNFLRASYVSGKHADALKGLEIQIGEGEAGWVAENRQVLINGSPIADMTAPLGHLANSYRSTAIFPLVTKDTLVGALALYSEEDRAYSPDEVRVLETISRHAAAAVYNALAFQLTQESALTDNLTGLPNSRYMYSFFDQERSRAERQGYPLVLMMMDLDGFKKVNDTFGHHVGDEILRRTAQITRRRLRIGDTLIRYAGDEFVAVLHHATLDVVTDLKQRLQSAVDNFSHEVRPGRAARVGISIGFATYGADGFAIDELMEVADQRMYEDKVARRQDDHAGRGQLYLLRERS